MPLLPPAIDNDYRGQKSALWIFGVLLLLKTTMSVNSIFNTRAVLINADGVPIDTWPAQAQRSIVALFAVWALGHLLLCITGALVLVRYRSAVPFMFALLLAEHLGRKLILYMMPIARTGRPPATAINLALLALIIIGFALSLWRRPYDTNRGIPHRSDDVARGAS